MIPSRNQTALVDTVNAYHANKVEGHFYDVMIMYVAFLMRTHGLFLEVSIP